MNALISTSYHTHRCQGLLYQTVIQFNLVLIRFNTSFNVIACYLKVYIQIYIGIDIRPFSSRGFSMLSPDVTYSFINS